MIKVVTINKKIKPNMIESNKILTGEGENVGSLEPRPINSFITLFKKYASNTH
jgi:hypothetical protein